MVTQTFKEDYHLLRLQLEGSNYLQNILILKFLFQLLLLCQTIIIADQEILQVIRIFITRTRIHME